MSFEVCQRRRGLLGLSVGMEGMVGTIFVLPLLRLHPQASRWPHYSQQAHPSLRSPTAPPNQQPCPQSTKGTLLECLDLGARGALHCWALWD